MLPILEGRNEFSAEGHVHLDQPLHADLSERIKQMASLRKGIDLVSVHCGFYRVSVILVVTSFKNTFFFKREIFFLASKYIICK